MDMTQVITIIAGIIISVLSYFTKATMDRLSKVEDTASATKIKLEILQNDHTNKNENLQEKIEALTAIVKELSIDIKELNKRLKD